MAHPSNLPKVQVSASDPHVLATEDGAPFVWIGDTVWRWYRLWPGEQTELLARRKGQGFNVIQCALTVPADDKPFDFIDGTTPFGGPDHTDIRQPDEAYWSQVDGWLGRIADHGLYAAPVLMWGWGGERYTEDQLYQYARWVGHRYRDDSHILWMSLGEGTHRTLPRAKIMAVVNGLRDGDTGHKILTIHADGWTTTTASFQAELDFHTWQTGQGRDPTDLSYTSHRRRPEERTGTWTVWDAISHDYHLEPAKPALDAEAWYEGPPPEIPRPAGPGGQAQAYQVRRRAYFTVFAGAFGHTYGADPVWLAARDQRPTWRDALSFPGGDQMRNLRQLLESRPMWGRMPDQSLIVGGQSDSYDAHVQATRASDGTYAFVYVADGHPIEVDLARMAGAEVIAHWFNPRTGESTPLGAIARGDSVPFAPPGSPGLDKDWVLVLDGRS